MSKIPYDILQLSEQFFKAVQMFALTLTDNEAMEIATVYPVWKEGVNYTVGTILQHGTNNVGDPQLYRIAQAHTSQADWIPEATPALYTPIGLTPAGYPEWSQPTGAHDAYNAGDIVDYKGVLYESLINGNTYSPEAYPAGWKEVES